MDMSGEYIIPAPRETVWNALNDPEILRQCIPGCETVEKTSDDSFAAKVTAKVGPVRAKFSGKVTLSDIDPPNGYTISGEGSGGAAGFAKGGARVALSDDPAGTKLSYTVDATVGGKLAQIGSRLIDSTARKMANDFFGRFAQIVVENGRTETAEPPSPAPAAPAASQATARPSEEAAAGQGEAIETGGTPSGKTEEPRTGISPIVWVSGIVAILAILLFLFQGKT